MTLHGGEAENLGTLWNARDASVSVKSKCICFICVVQYGDKALQLVWFLEPQINKNPCIFWEIGICFSGNFRFGEEFKQPSRIQSTLSNSNSLGDHENVRITKGSNYRRLKLQRFEF